jgi:hypothetical protein
MGTAKIIFAGAAAFALLASPILADDLTGMVTRIDRLGNTISIQQTQKGTVGASSGGTGPVQQYKAKDAAMLDAVHAGDRVTFAVTSDGGTATITKLQKQ